jgi:hypothetical protein
VRNLLLVPSDTWRLKVMMQDVSVKQEGEKESGVEQSDEQKGRNVEEIQEVNDGQHEV